VASPPKLCHLLIIFSAVVTRGVQISGQQWQVAGAPCGQCRNLGALRLARRKCAAQLIYSQINWTSRRLLLRWTAFFAHYAKQTPKTAAFVIGSIGYWKRDALQRYRTEYFGMDFVLF
jgi:hypothetical protein